MFGCESSPKWLAQMAQLSSSQVRVEPPHEESWADYFLQETKTPPAI